MYSLRFRSPKKQISASTQPIFNTSVVQTFARKHYVFDCGWIQFPTETWKIEQRTNQFSILRFETPKLGPCLTPNLGVKSVFPVLYLFRMFSDSQFHEIQQTMWNSAAKFQSPPGGRMTRNFSPHRPRLQAISPRWVPGVFSAGGRGACFRSLLMLEIIMVTSMFFMCSMIVPPIMVKSPDINLTYGKSLR